MTISVLAEADAAPPRVAVNIAVPSGSVMKSVSVFRSEGGVRSLLRSQPAAGFDSRTVHDHEMPYGIPLVYSWESEYFDPALFATVFSEPWASLAAWTGDTSIASISGGKVTLSPVFGGQWIARSGTMPWTRLRFGSLAGAPHLTLVDVLGLGTSGLRLSVTSGGLLRVQSPQAFVTTTVLAADPFTLTQTGSAVLVEGTGGAVTVPYEYQMMQGLRILANTDSLTVVGSIAVQVAGATATVAESSAPVVIDSDHAWLIHPAVPALSFAIAERDNGRAGIARIGEVANRSTAHRHDILGSDRPITTTSGPRGADEFTVMVETVTRAEELALKGVLKDQTPILFRVPPSWGVDFEDGFYSVGDVSRARLAQVPNLGLRHHVLPLVSVDSPVVVVQNSGWSWAALAAEFESWEAVAQAFATWADVAENIRRPGY